MKKVTSIAEPSQPAPAATTKAWTFSNRGRPSEVLRLDRAYPMPAFPPSATTIKAAKANPGDEWVLIKVAYAALNPGTFFYLRILPAFFRCKVAVPEIDFSGVVEDVWTPPDVVAATTSSPSSSPKQTQRLSKGDRVLGFLPVSFSWPTGTGALQGHLAVPSRHVVKMSQDQGAGSGAGLREAAGLLLAAGVAWEVALAAKVERGMRVLVNGASGGIGTYAVQIARHIVGEEGFVVGVCSGRNVELVKSLRVDEVVDYTQHSSLATELRNRYVTGNGPNHDKPFDAVLDCVGIQSLYVRCAEYLKPEGIYGSVGVKLPAWTLGNMIPTFCKIQANALWPRARWLGGTGRTWAGVTVMDISRENMERLAGMLADGTIRTVVDSEWAFDNVLPAYEVLESSRARGKIIIRVSDDVK